MTTTTADSLMSDTAPAPLDRLLDASLLVAPLLYLVVDTLYAARGWQDGPAGALHVVAAIGYGLVVLRVALWLPRESRLLPWLVLVGLAGCVGNAAYGFEAIHMSLGDVQLVDQPGAANVIKPLGLLFPLSLALVALVLGRWGRRWQAALVGLALVLWPVGHIGNLHAVAVAANVVLVVALASLVWGQDGQISRRGADRAGC